MITKYISQTIFNKLWMWFFIVWKNSVSDGHLIALVMDKWCWRFSRRRRWWRSREARICPVWLEIIVKVQQFLKSAHGQKLNSFQTEARATAKRRTSVGGSQRGQSVQRWRSDSQQDRLGTSTQQATSSALWKLPTNVIFCLWGITIKQLNDMDSGRYLDISNC